MEDLTSKLLALPQRKYRPNRRCSALTENQLEIEKNRPVMSPIPASQLLTSSSDRRSRLPPQPSQATIDRLKPPPSSTAVPGKIKLTSLSNQRLKPPPSCNSSQCLELVSNTGTSPIGGKCPVGSAGEMAKTSTNLDASVQRVGSPSNSSTANERLRPPPCVKGKGDASGKGDSLGKGDALGTSDSPGMRSSVENGRGLTNGDLQYSATSSDDGCPSVKKFKTSVITWP